MTDREPDKAARISPQQKGVAETARRDGADLGAEIEPRVKRFGSGRPSALRRRLKTRLFCLKLMRNERSAHAR